MAHTGITVKKVAGHKPTLEDMYLLDDGVKMDSKIEEARAFLYENGEDPDDYTDEQLTNMIEQGF